MSSGQVVTVSRGRQVAGFVIAGALVLLFVVLSLMPHDITPSLVESRCRAKASEISNAIIEGFVPTDARSGTVNVQLLGSPVRLTCTVTGRNDRDARASVQVSR